MATSSRIEKVHIMVEPPSDWLVKPPAVSAPGNPEMLRAMLHGRTHMPGSGATIIRSLAGLYEELGLRVALFESSQAAQRVTKRIIGTPDPDDVFTVDYCTGHDLGSGEYVNIINRMSAATRLLEPFVMCMITTRLGVKNVIAQDEGAKFEGGDLNFIPRAINDSESVLITGGGANSRSNDSGREWLLKVLQPTHHITVVSDKFHKDLVSAFAQDTRGALVLALLALDCISNKDEVLAALSRLNIDVLPIPEEAADRCALNVSVNPGLLVGVQYNEKLSEVLRRGLPPGIEYHVLPHDLQHHTNGFVDMQGGANCSSGHLVVEPDDVDLSNGNIKRINEYLHSYNCEDELEAIAEQIGMSDAVMEQKERDNLSRAA